MTQSPRNTAAPNARETTAQRSETLTDHPVPRVLLVVVRTVGFWTAVVTPLLYLPLLLTGIDTDLEAVAFLTLLVLNVAGLVLGRSYNA